MVLRIRQFKKELSQIFITLVTFIKYYFSTSQTKNLTFASVLLYCTAKLFICCRRMVLVCTQLVPATGTIQQMGVVLSGRVDSVHCTVYILCNTSEYLTFNKVY